MKRSRFGLLPADLLRELDVGEIAVVAILAVHANRRGQCFLRQDTIAKLVGRSRPWVNATLARLEEKGRVQQVHRRFSHGGLRSSLYCIMHDFYRQDDVNQADKPHQDPDRESQDADTEQTEVLDQESHSLPCPPVEYSDELPFPSDEDLAWGQDQAPHLPAEAIRRHWQVFLQKCEAKAYRYRSQRAAWRAWFLQDAPQLMPQAPSGRSPGGHSPPVAQGCNQEKAERLSAITAGHSQAEVVVGFMKRFADGRRLALPDPDVIALDVQVMAQWPREDIKRAERLAVEHFPYRRIPTAADLKRLLDEDKKRKVPAAKGSVSPLFSRKIEQAEAAIKAGRRPHVDRLVAAHLSQMGHSAFEVAG